MRHQVIDDLVDEFMPPRAYAEQWNHAGAEKAVVERLNGIQEYPADFKKAFPGDKVPVTFHNFAKA